MKTRILSLCIVFTIFTGVFGQTADILVSQGRGYLVQKDALNAQARFESALALSPNHADANALLAAARLLTLGNTPEGGALLDRLGMSATGRNSFYWRSDLPRDANDDPVLPTNFSASELSAFLKTNVIPALRASETNLSRITNTNYTMNLSSAETGSDNVVIDYGDVQMLRATLKALEYLGLTLYSWNLNAQLTTLQSYLTNENATVQEFLATNPQLFTFATTNDLFAAREAFLASAERYFVASEWIRFRPQYTVYLFNLDLEFAGAESEFRQTLIDLTNSLVSPVVLVNHTNLTVHLAKHFNGQTSPRSLLPSLHGNGFLVGSLPDPTFGGLIQGWSRDAFEELLARYLNPVQQITGTLLQSPRRFSVGFPTQPHHYYSVERSTDLNYWESVAEFLAPGTNYNYVDSSVSGAPAGYYRLVDLSKYLSIEGRVVDACSGLPISNAWVTTSFDPNVAVTDASGKFFLQTEVNALYGITIYAFADGHFLFQQDIWADEDISDYVVGLSPGSSPVPANDQFANRILLSGPSPSGSGSTCGATHDPIEPVGGDSVWWAWTAPFSGSVHVKVEANGSALPQVNAYIEGLPDLIQVYSSPFSSYLDVSAGETYFLSFSTTGGSVGFQFSLVSQPTFILATPTNGATFIAPASIPFAGTFASPGSVIGEARFYANDTLISTTTNSVVGFVWSNVSPNFYYLNWEGEDSNGETFGDYRFITVRPGNDNFTNRIPLAGATALVQGDNTLASSEAGEPSHGGGFGGHSLWWNWTAASNGPVTVAANGSDYNAQMLGVYTGLTVANLSLVVSNLGTQQGSQVSFGAVAGNAYQIAVDGYGQGPLQLSIVPAAAPTVSIMSPTNGQVFVRGQTILLQALASDSDGTIQNVSFSAGSNPLGGDGLPPYEWTFTTSATDGFYSCSATVLDSQGLVGHSPEIYFQVVPPPPANDHYTNRFQLTGSSLTTTGYNFSATKEIGEPNHGGNAGGASAWWQWTPTASGLAVVSTLGSTFDTLLGVYQGTNVANLILLATNNNDGYLQTSRVGFPVIAGTAYQIAVDGNSGLKGNINLVISMPATSASLAAALETTNFVWTGGAAIWTSQSLTTHDGTDAAQSGGIQGSQETWMEAVVLGPGSGSFWWVVSSQASFDLLSFQIDGVPQAFISGTTAWANRSFALSAGTHTLRWQYAKNASVISGSDRGWVDQLTFTPSP